LGEDIKKHGLISSITLVRVGGDFQLLDGRDRLDAMELVGVLDWEKYPTAGGAAIQALAKGDDPYDHVVAANLHRRHLTGEQKRELIAKVLKAKPEASNRKIAKQTKADHKTVAAVRGDLESTGEIPQLEKTTGADGKQRKSRAKKVPEPMAVPHKRATGPTEISIEQRRADHAALGEPPEMPTQAEAEESYQETLYEQACLLLDEMAGATRQRFFAYLTAAYGDAIVERCLSLLMAMTKDQRAQFFAKYTELSAARAPARLKSNHTNAAD
jgi:hypothetical protein